MTVKYEHLFNPISIGIIAVILLMAACHTDAKDPKNVATYQKPNQITPNIIDYHNGVYYFDYIGADFSNALSTFIATFPELQLVAIANDGTGPYGCTKGYFVVFIKKNHDYL